MTLSADLKGKKALVTGASSEGFGKFFAQVLAQSGAEVVVSARREKALQALTNEIQSGGGEASYATMDVTDIAVVKSVIKQHGPFDIIVNNAGVQVAKPILDQTDDDYTFVMDTNLSGVWNVGKEGARNMVENDIQGSIINIASITGLRQISGNTPYATSKSAVIQLTKQMGLEFARYGIRANAIAPGFFASDLTRDFLESENGKALMKRIPMRRFGDYESLRGPLLLLASDSPSFMTGSVITVDGGHLINSL